MDIKEIDGGILEGGGQVLRVAISLSAILGIPVKIINIRTRRSKPGLAAQHLIGLKLVADMCRARLKGDSIGSTEVVFIPGNRICGGHYVADTRTAGSISLLMQVALPCALLADGPVTLDLKGGTNAEMAPQIDYMTQVFRNALNMFGATFDLTIHRRGYYPIGGGFVTVEVKPIAKFTAAKIVERGTVRKIVASSFVSGTLPLRLAGQMSEGLKEVLNYVETPLEVNVYKEDIKVAPHNCSGIIAVCETSSGCRLGADGLGKRGADPYAVGRAAGEQLLKTIKIGVCLDQHLQDQMIVYMVLAEGKSSLCVGELTLHTQTAICIAESVSKVQFDFNHEGDKYFIYCTGARAINRFHPSVSAPGRHT